MVRQRVWEDGNVKRMRKVGERVKYYIFNFLNKKMRKYK